MGGARACVFATAELPHHRRRDHFRSEGILDRFEPAGLVVEVAEIIVHEADEPNLLADLLDADALAGEDGAEIDLLAIEADAPACGHGDGSVVEWVIEFRQAAVGTR